MTYSSSFTWCWASIMNMIKHTWIVTCSRVMTEGELSGASLFSLMLFMTKKPPYTAIVVFVYVTTQRCCMTTRNRDNEAEKSVGSKGEAGKEHSLEVQNVPLNEARCVFGIFSPFLIINFYCFQLPFILYCQVPLPTNMGSLRVEKDKVVVGGTSGGATLDHVVAAIKVSIYT